MMDFLCGLNKIRRQAIESGNRQFPQDVARRYRGRYMEIVSCGRQNKKTKHKYAQKEEKALLNRLEKYMDNHLLFIYDFNVGFDNNMSERDLRKIKNRQKIAGGSRKISEQEMFCNILTIIETLKRRNMEILENIKMFFEGTPVLL
jgi:transposase